jgi:hypothetical protein
MAGPTAGLVPVENDPTADSLTHAIVLTFQTPNSRHGFRSHAIPPCDRIVRPVSLAMSLATYEGSQQLSGRCRRVRTKLCRCRVPRKPHPQIAQKCCHCVDRRQKIQQSRHPYKNAGIVDEPMNIFDGNARRIAKFILAHRSADFHDARNINSRCLADQADLPRSSASHAGEAIQKTSIVGNRGLAATQSHR